MINKIVPVMVLILLVAVGCKPKKDYADVKAFLNDAIKNQETVISSLEKAKSGKDVAAALNKNKEVTAVMMKKMTELTAKYPELKDSKEAPADLKPLNDKLQELAKKSVQVMTDVMKKYEKDPDVKKALQP